MAGEAIDADDGGFTMIIDVSPEQATPEGASMCDASSRRKKHLVVGNQGRHFRGTMKRWSWHQTRVLLLAILLGLGMSLSFVQGSVMAAAMAVAG